MYLFSRKTLFAALIAGTASPAFSADIAETIEYVPASVGGWYIRGHIGMSNQDFDGLEADIFSEIYDHGWHDRGGFASAPIAGGGIGYQFNDNLRADLTVEWRGKSDFDALDWTEWEPGDRYNNKYSGKKSELVFMANAYYDIATISGITPYIGAGIGASYNKISHFVDTNSVAGGGYAADNGEWDFAWALHAGLGFKATDRMTIDLGYSFLSLGDAKTGKLHTYDPSTDFDNDGLTFKDIYSHDFKLGIRYALN